MSTDPAEPIRHGTLVPGPWTPRVDIDPPGGVLEPGPDDVLDATEPRTSRWQQALTASAAEPVAPLVFRDPTRALATTGYVGRELARIALRRALRPWEALRVLPPAGRGLWRAASAWARWVTARDIRFDHVARPGVQVASRSEIRDNQKIRAAVSGAGLVGFSVGETVGYLMVGFEVPTLTGLGVLTLAWAFGRQPGERRATLLLGSQTALRPGVPVGMLAKTIVAGLDENRVSAEVAALPQEARWGWTVAVITEDEITDKTVRALERKLRTRRNAITPIADPNNAAQTLLRIVHTDLLAQVGAPPHHKPTSLTITRPADLGKTMGGGALLLELLRVHALMVGGTGSGKSSALWTKIDFYTACRDVVVWGIDLTGGPVFTAWGDCIQRVATTVDQARDLLESAIRIAVTRTTLLGQRSRPRLDGPPAGDENWNPAADGPALEIVIDEYPVLVDAKLGDLVTTLGRIGRKVAVQVTLAAQKSGRGDLGNTTIRAMAEVQILLPCASGDVDMLWPGKRAEGWRPDLLKGASGRRANDAGKAFINASGHDEPEASRFYRLELADIHTRTIERMKAGLPILDELSQRASDSDMDISDVIVREVPKLLQDLADAFDARGSTRLPSVNACEYLFHADPQEYADLATDGTREDTLRASKALAQLLARHGLAPGQLGGPSNPRGYRRTDLDQAISGDLPPL